MIMKVLFGCEESATCREEWRKAGHDAWSCDLFPSRIPGQHIQDDIYAAIAWKMWDLIMVFPPCTHLAVSGNRWYADTKERSEALRWTIALWNHICTYGRAAAMENPIGVLSKWRKPSQIIHPWQFGHGEVKATCLWLHNLTKLRPSQIVDGREPKVWKMAPSPTRQRDRAVTYIGIARATVVQWGTAQELVAA